MPWLFLLFLSVPILEIALLLRVGSAIGWFTTLLAVILTAALGTWMLRRQGLKTLQTARGRMDAGELPAEQLVEGIVLLVGGALLLTPGFATDAIGFCCLVPASRQWLARRIGERARLQAGAAMFGGTAGPGAARPGAGPAAHGGPDVGGRADRSGQSAPGGNSSGNPAGNPGGDRGARSGNVIDGEYEHLD